MTKRTWHYNQPPKVYGIEPCQCGNVDTEWSEYQGNLWCPICKVDYIPKHWGVFDGPINLNLCRLMGIDFDRWNLETNEFEEFDVETLEYRVVKLDLWELIKNNKNY
jgi:hypothetical protein